MTMTIEAQKKLRDLFLLHPTKSNLALCKLSGETRALVKKYRDIYDEQIDQEFISMTAGKFINEFGKAIDYWKLQINELEELKNRTKTIFKINDKKKRYSESVPLDPMDILSICKQQAELRKYIIFLGSQGEVREVIKIMRSGKLPVIQ